MQHVLGTKTAKRKRTDLGSLLQSKSAYFGNTPRLKFIFNFLYHGLLQLDQQVKIGAHLGLAKEKCVETSVQRNKPAGEQTLVRSYQACASSP